MYELAALMGWIGILGYAIALLNFVMKYTNKKYIVKLPKENDTFIKGYRAIMKPIVKYHKFIGTVASIATFIHFILMYMYVELSISGLIAALVMWFVFLLGIYGAVILKKSNGSWVKIHKYLSFALVLLIVCHVILVSIE